MQKQSYNQFDVILFDIDNVLIDTRESYLACILKTVETYQNRPGIITLKDIDRFKLLGGFNDDWDCCYGIITFLDTAIQGKPIRHGDHRRQRLSISELGALMPQRPLGIEGLLRGLKVIYERVELPSRQKISRIFQELYLGKKGKPGLIRKEKPIFPKSVFEKLKKQGVRFGIVTGRNKYEAEYALKRFGILKYFDAVVTIDDIVKAEKKTGKFLRKPEAWPVLEAASRISKLAGRKNLKFLYVGDLPDDVLAGKRAGKKIFIKTAAYPALARDLPTTLSELRKLKPDFLLKKPHQIFNLCCACRARRR